MNGTEWDQTERDLDRAAGHFARAVTLGGIDLIAVILLRRSARPALKRGAPKVSPGLMDAGPPPSSGGKLFYRPKISRVAKLPRGYVGKTDPYGNISVLRTQTLTEQQLTLYHEWVHSVLSPRLVPLQRLRASLAITGYQRSALLTYLEEALAQSYARLRVLGLAHAWKGITFPIGPPGYAYVTVAQLVSEGAALGTIVLGGQLFRVHVIGAIPQPTRSGVR